MSLDLDFNSSLIRSSLSIFINSQLNSSSLVISFINYYRITNNFDYIPKRYIKLNNYILVYSNKQQRRQYLASIIANSIDLDSNNLINFYRDQYLNSL